ncbi:MAG: ECF transporter S component [Thermoproteota archaeon]
MTASTRVGTSVSRRVVTVGLCAALYTVIGILSNLGLFTPVIGVVKFWPAVFIPAIFAMLFGPSVGGMGAAIGIFLADLYTFYTSGQTNPLLSIIAGVPANFMGFYILGKIGRSKVKYGGWRMLIPLAMLGTAAAAPLLYAEYTFRTGFFDQNARWVSIVLLVFAIIVFIMGLLAGRFRRNYLSYYVGGTIGLLLGGAWIGFGIWIYSQFFGLPLTGIRADLATALGYFIWVFGTEAPFMLIVPPILDTMYRVYPFLKSVEENG